MTKRILSAIGLLVLVVSLAYSGGQGENAQGDSSGAKKTLTVWIYREYINAINDSWTAMTNKFQQDNPNIQVQLVWIPGDEGVTKYAVAVETNSLPDVGYMFDRTFPLYQRSGQFMDVSELFGELGQNAGGWYDRANVVTVNGRQYGIPVAFYTDGLTIRKDRLDAAGVGVPETWADLLNVAKKTSDPSNGIYGFGQGLSGKNGDFEKWFREILWSYGGSVFGSDSKTVTINSDATRHVLQWIKDGWDAGIFPPDVFQWDGSGNNKSYASGQGNIIVNTESVIWDLRLHNKELADKTVGALLPSGPALRGGYTETILLTIAKTTKNAEAAKSYIRYVMENDRYSAHIAQADGAMQPTRQVFEKDPIWQDPTNKAFLEMVKYCKVQGYPGHPTAASSEVMETGVMGDMVGDVILRHMSIDDAVKKAEQRVTTIVQRHANEQP